MIRERLVLSSTSRMSASSKVAPNTSWRAAEGVGSGCSLQSMPSSLVRVRLGLG